MRLTITPGRLLLCFGILLALIAGLPAQSVTAGSFYKTYTSVIDGSAQPYGLYVPASYAQYTLHPVIFTTHGFGGHASSAFSSVAITFAESHGFLLVQLEGRGNTFYDGPGETDFFEVLQDLRAHYAVDEDHLYIEGASMGATGAYRLAIRYPDIFAAGGGADGWTDYRIWHQRWYAPLSNPTQVEPSRVPNLEMASCVDMADNAQWLSLDMIVDTNDTTVEPQNTYNLDARLTALAQSTGGGFAHAVQSTPGGHCAGYDQGTLYGYFLGKSRTPAPQHVTIKTKRLRNGKHYWASIDRMNTLDTFAVLDATVTGNTVAVTTTNVLACTLTLDTTLVDTNKLVVITMNGQSVYSGAAGTIALYTVQDAGGNITGWSTADPLPAGLRKTSTLEGPIGMAFTDKFRVAYGTDPSDKSEADAFCNNWNLWMNAAISDIPAASLTPADTAASNLLLFGTESSNSYLAAIAAQLPLHVASTGITLGAAVYSGTNYGAFFIYPNPNNPQHYVVISHKSIPGAAPKDLEALPWYWPDYVVFDTNKAAGACVQSSLAYLPATFVNAGYFTTTWALPGAPATVSTPVISPAAGSYLAQVTITLTCATPGATIYYTTNGSTPTAKSAVYTAPFTLSAAATVQACALCTGLQPSAVASAGYQITTLDPYEPDSTPQTAHAIANGETQQRSLMPTGDTDWATFTLAARSSILLQTAGATGNTRLWLFGPNSYTTQLAYADGVSTFAKISLSGASALEAGTYYAKITTSSANSTVKLYTLSLTATPAPRVATPVFSPVAGVYDGSVTVGITCTTPGAAIYYTTNGATPTTSSSLYQGSFTLTASGTLKAYATAAGMTDSLLSAAVYTVNRTVATPAFTPAPCSFTGSTTVAITCATTGAVIYYTKDGSAPTTKSPTYAGPLTLTATTTLRALACKAGMNNSAVAAGLFSIITVQPVATPAFTPVPGIYGGSATVSMATSTSGASIYYTTNGTTPTSASTVYTGAITLTATTTLKAIAIKSGLSNSSVASGIYTITPAAPASAPIMSPAPGTYTKTVTVTLASTIPGATIRYTTNGLVPTATSTLYTGPFVVKSTVTIKAKVYKSGMAESAITSGSYLITGGS